MDIKFTTGEMALLHNISKQTLIHYDRISLFKPFEISRQNKYRYYSLSQCEELGVILCLRNLGMSLGEIKTYLNKKDTNERISLLEAHEAVVSEKIESIKRSKSRLDLIISSLKSRLEIRPFEMGIKKLEERYILKEPVNPPHDEYQCELAIEKLFKSIGKRDDTDIHELMVFSDFSKDQDDILTGAGLEIINKSGEKIDAGLFGYIYHKGSFESIRSARRQLCRFIDDSGFKPENKSIVKILLDALAVSEKDEYLVEVQIQVKKS